jgi:GT2 family glycosyltransferase
MLNAMRADSEIGILGPELIGPDGKALISRFRHPSPISEFVDATGTDIVYRLFRNHVVPIGHDEEAEIEWIGFPCVMFRKRMIDEIGFLDERYFMYFEDIAYCHRAKLNGWKIRQCLDAHVDHFCGQSSKVESQIDTKERLPAYYYASRARYFVSMYGRVGFVCANILWYLGRLVSYFRLLTLRPPSRVCASRALDIWTGPDHPRPVNKR